MSTTDAPDLEVAKHLLRIEGTLARVFRREGFEGVCRRTPLHDLIAGEEGEHVLEGAEADATQDIRNSAFIAAIRFVFADGPHPNLAMKRLYALARAVDPESIARMNGTDLAQIFGETRAAQSYRVKMMFRSVRENSKAKQAKLPFQKTPDACAKYAAAQVGNQNRLGGKIAALARAQQAEN